MQERKSHSAGVLAGCRDSAQVITRTDFGLGHPLRFKGKDGSERIPRPVLNPPSHVGPIRPEFLAKDRGQRALFWLDLERIHVKHKQGQT
jgi:hypothetical protein